MNRVNRFVRTAHKSNLAQIMNKVVPVGQREERMSLILALDSSRRRMSLSCLDEQGDVLTEESLDEEPDSRSESVQVYTKDTLPQSGTNLGDVLRQALEKKP